MSRTLEFTRYMAVGLTAMALTLGGCGGGGGSSSSSAPPPAEEPVIADPAPAVPLNAAVARTSYAITPTVEITSATVIDNAVDPNDGRLTVTFSVTDQSGNPITTLTSGLSFIVAQLIPSAPLYDAAATQSAQHPYIWQSYINRVENAASGTNQVGSAAGLPVYTQALQATTESNGTLTHTGGGVYTYTFAKNLKAASFDAGTPANGFFPVDPATLGYSFLGDAALAFDATRTHRVAIQLSRVTSGTTRAPANAWLDFVPAGGAPTVTKNVATTESCNSCHDGRLALHGGNRVEVEFCVTCHNPGTLDANSGFNLDMANMVHKIHRGAKLPSVKAGGEYAIWGYGASKHDYSEVIYPSLYYGMEGEPLNCSHCHTNSAETPDGDNWLTKVSDLACFSCHDTLVDGKPFAYNAGASYSRHAVTGSNPFPSQTNIASRNCGGCHSGTSTLNLRRTAVAHQYHFSLPQFQYSVESVTVNAERQPVVKFRIDWRADSTVAAFTPVDLLGADFVAVTDAEGKVTGYSGATGSPFEGIKFGPSFALVYSTDGADWAPETAMGQPESVSLVSLRAGTGGTLVANGDGTYTATLAKSYPEGAARRAIFMQGYFTEGSTRLSTFSPLVHVTGDLQRRSVVAKDKCLGCHGSIGFHGGNRVDNPLVCAGCHNSRLTSSGHTLPDGKPEDEVTNNFKDMIHGIHGGTLVGVRNFSGRATAYDFTTIHYPGILSNCQACHNPGTYEAPASNAAVTTNVTIDRTATTPGADDRVTSPYAASCVGCHNGTEARSHIEASGGFVRAKRSEVQSTEGGCVRCHGAGSTIAPVEDVHSGLN